MVISTEHISLTNIVNTDSPSLIPKFPLTINQHISTVFIPKTDIDNMADNLQVLITRSYIYIGEGQSDAGRLPSVMVVTHLQS